MKNYTDIIDALNQMTWLQLKNSIYPSERYYNIIGTDFYFYINPISILWVYQAPNQERHIVCSLEMILEVVPKKIQSELLFNLDIFRYSLSNKNHLV